MPLMNLRVSDEEKIAWTALADKAGLSLSAWIRQSLNTISSDKPPILPKPAKASEPKRGGRFDLPGQNLNSDPERAARITQTSIVPVTQPIKPEPCTRCYVLHKPACARCLALFPAETVFK